MLFNRMLGVTLGFLALVAATAMARADGPMLYFGVHGGKSFAKSDLSADLAPGFPLEINGVSMDGLVAGAHGGFDVTLTKGAGWTPFGGLWASYSFQNTEFDAKLGTTVISATMGDSWAFGGRIGMQNGGIKVYALAGYRQTDLDLAIADLLDQKLKGWDAGLGVQFPIAANLNLGLEGIWTKFDKEEFISAAGGPTGLFHQTDQLSLMARLSLQFGAPAAVTEAIAPVQQAAPAPAAKAKVKR